MIGCLTETTTWVVAKPLVYTKVIWFMCIYCMFLTYPLLWKGWTVSSNSFVSPFLVWVRFLLKEIWIQDPVSLKIRKHPVSMVSFAQFGSDFLEILPLHKNNFLGLESSFSEIRSKKVLKVHPVIYHCKQ